MKHPFVALGTGLAVMCSGVGVEATEFAETSKTERPTIYRCGNLYSHRPCTGGRPVSASDPRTAQQQQSHQKRTERERVLADQMEKQRLDTERQVYLQSLQEAKRADAQHLAEQSAKEARQRSHLPETSHDPHRSWHHPGLGQRPPMYRVPRHPTRAVPKPGLGASGAKQPHAPRSNKRPPDVVDSSDLPSD